MTGPQRQVYRLIVALHPEAFRDEFGREMTLDCEDALRERGFAPLLGDALLSLGRQWKVRLISGPELAAVAVGEPVPGHPFLSGQYVAIGRGPSVNLFDLARASAISLLLVLTIGFAASVPNRRVIGDVQTLHVSHDGGVDTGNNQPPIAGHAHKEAPGPQDALAGSGSTQFHGRIYLSPRPTGLSSGVRASGGPTAIRSLADAVREFILITLIIWITSYFLSRTPGAARKIFLVALGLLGIAASVAFGQLPTPPIHAQILHATGPLPSFEVATVKPAALLPPPPPPPPPGMGDNRPPPPRMVGIGKLGGQRTDRVHLNEPAAFMILFAYNLPFGSERTRIVGAPDWLYSVPYEVQAKIDDSLFAAMQKMTADQQREQVDLMEQSLLADRFKLKVHFETREMPVYALVAGKGGPKLIPAKDGETKNISSLNGDLIAKAVTLDEFANSSLWTPIGGRIVVDQTGLKGAYDFTLLWTTDQQALNAAAGDNTDAPPLFTAIQQQLGLKLVPTKTPVEVIVIDHIERPSEN